MGLYIIITRVSMKFILTLILCSGISSQCLPPYQVSVVYDNMYTYIEPASIPQLVLILADYQYKNSFAADHELNTVACLTEVMAGVQFK